MPKDKLDDKSRFDDALKPQDRNVAPEAMAATVSFHVESEQNGSKKQKTITFDSDDIIAFFAGLIALLFGISMIVGWVPINGWTIGVITLSGVTPGLAKIAMARIRNTKR